MALSEAGINRAWARLMRHWSDERDVTTINKHDLRAAIVGFDEAIDANISTINGWIPQPARGKMSAAHKIELMAVLLNARRI